MNSFLDMAPTTARVVVVGEARYPVPGVKLKGIAYLLKRYWEPLAPVIAKMKAAAESKADGADASLLEDILALPDDIIAAIIAAGMGHAGSDQAEAIADSLAVGVQARLLAAIVGETMPDGAVPFVESVVTLFVAIAREKAASERQPAAPSRTSRKRSTT
jgi:hypothetical protein